jgi:hypothetical protein
MFSMFEIYSLFLKLIGDRLLVKGTAGIMVIRILQYR